MTIAKTARLCNYCSLPLPASNKAVAEGPEFCCVGCKIAASIAGQRCEEGDARAMITRLGLAIFFSMNVMAFTMALWSQEWNGELSPAAQVTFDLLRYACLFFSLPVLLLLGGPLASSVFDELRRGRVTTDLLIAAGVVAAYAYSLVSVFRGSGHVYFEVGCMVLTTLTLGRYLEATGKLKTTQALRDLESLLPENVRRITGKREETVPASEVRRHDLLRILPGERIPVDGVILSGRAEIDEQVVTGESQPAAKEAGGRVFSGTLNRDGDLQIRAAAPPSQSALRKLIDAVVAAASGQERYCRLADRITHWFLPVIFAIAAATLATHWYYGGLTTGTMTALAVVLIACPCALGLATPMALWSAVGRASRNGILFRDGDCLNRLAEVDLVCFDKTGTLTSGEPKLSAVYLNNQVDVNQALAVAGTIASATTHPLAAALRNTVDQRIGDEEAFHTKTVPGRGVTAQHAQLGAVYFGSLRLLEEAGVENLVALRSCPMRNDVHRSGSVPDAGQGILLSSDVMKFNEVIRSHADASLVALAYAGKVQAIFFFAEHIRDGAVEAIEHLKQSGLEVHMLTGDRQSRAESLADQLGIAASFQLLPEQKLEKIEHWKRSGRNLLMIGDGLNDGPALAAAHVGIALGCGADLSRELADVCLLSNDLSRIPDLLQLGRDTVRTIRWNLLWAFGYNAVGVLLAAAGLLHPIIAAAAMVGSSVLVVSNSLRLSGTAEQDCGGKATGLATSQSGRPAWETTSETSMTPVGSAS